MCEGRLDLLSKTVPLATGEVTTAAGVFVVGGVFWIGLKCLICPGLSLLFVLDALACCLLLLTVESELFEDVDVEELILDRWFALCP